MTKRSQLEQHYQQIVSCRKCPRLVEWREEVTRAKRKAYKDQEYWGRPVPGFGDPKARVLVVGLAPGAHGSNRTGRQFTGDASGNFLYPALYKAGYANQPTSESRSDGLVLQDMYITASGRCAPPDNKPSPEELNQCQPYLERELEIIDPKVIVCLGRIAFERILKIYSVRNPVYKFAHGASYPLENGKWVLCSYHPSQQNTSTKKLTVEMFDTIWVKAGELSKRN
ncbi:MAG TPA: uracil-DNA glycosylase [Anaerolineales bacterium]|nr:uracil-DNA glycosylase [Anaerolineales bacterium]HNN13173.1 uracil-DNA glycosylase [Anaerolineales bacterium]HNO30930.1 uracil-DNA glycosylase [Anaerolineales bacterium]